MILEEDGLISDQTLNDLNTLELCSSIPMGLKREKTIRVATIFSGIGAVEPSRVGS